MPLKTFLKNLWYLPTRITCNLIAWVTENDNWLFDTIWFNDYPEGYGDSCFMGSIFINGLCAIIITYLLFLVEVIPSNI
jgi:hypothetical protein